MTQEITREQAVALSHTQFWQQMTPRDIAVLQLFTPRLCVPFSTFHEAIEKAVDRPVFSHEFGIQAMVDNLKQALLAGAPEPTFDELVELIPQEHRHLVLT